MTCLLLCGATTLPLVAQSNIQSEGVAKNEEKKTKKAWEFGVGGTLQKLNRVYCYDTFMIDDNYVYDAKMRHALWGGDLYVARELNKHLYLDLTAGIGGGNVRDENHERKTKLYYSTSLGLQWRLAPLFKTKAFDPYLRVGVGYTHRTFDINYNGVNEISNDMLDWIANNIHRKVGDNVRNIVTISTGVGINYWVSNRWGMGLQANYLFVPDFIDKQKGVKENMQGVVRILVRIGGEDKREVVKQDVVRYIDNVIYEPVEKIVEIERIKEVERGTLLLFQNINFLFDSSKIDDSCNDTLDQIAESLKSISDRHILVTGYSDKRGDSRYNLILSRKRAASVVAALEARGVPKSMLKSRGVGSVVAIMPGTSEESIREADRKVTVEIINNNPYWERLPKSDL